MIDLKEKGAPNAVTGYGSVFCLILISGCGSRTRSAWRL